MKVKSDFIHEVITHNAKITPKFLYYAKLLKGAIEPHNEVWGVFRTPNDNVYCRADLKLLIDDEEQIELIGCYNWHGQKI